MVRTYIDRAPAKTVASKDGGVPEIDLRRPHILPRNSRDFGIVNFDSHRESEPRTCTIVLAAERRMDLLQSFFLHDNF